MEFRESESGQALVLTAICMTVLVGFLGLALDAGLLFRSRQNVQIAADAAATAAALDYLYNNSATSAVAAGKSAAAVNGYTDGSGGVTVTVNVPPQSGPDQLGGYAEAIVKAPNTTNFMAVLGMSTVTVAARAVAGDPTIGPACIWLMAQTGTGLYLQGSYDVTATNCGLYVNSTSSNAVVVTGNSGTLTADFLDVVGNNIAQHLTSPTPVTGNTAARSSPWGNLTGPSTPGDCSLTSALTSVTTTNQSTVSGSASAPVVCFTNAVTLNNGVVLPGASAGVVYVFENGVTIANGATVTLGSGTYDASTGTYSTTTGAVMELQTGTLTQASNSVLNIYAPTAGAYDGIAIFQPSTNTTQLQVQFGSNNETFDGYIYAPGANVYLQDSGGGQTSAGVVAYSLTNQTTNVTINSYDKANSGTTLNRVITLVE